MQRREKYFYTVLFLDDYFPQQETTKPEFEYQVELPKIRSFEIGMASNTAEV